MVEAIADVDVAIDIAIVGGVGSAAAAIVVDGNDRDNFCCYCSPRCCCW